MTDCGCRSSRLSVLEPIEYCPLHVAAPELLEACKAILLRLDVEAKGKGQDAVFLGNALRPELRAAIRKAEGINASETKTRG